MRCVRIVSGSTLIFAFVLLTLAPVGHTKSSTNVIRVWTVGSPHTNALPPAVAPPELRQRAESLGYTIQVEPFRAWRIH
jgi:hypothetical protein